MYNEQLETLINAALADGVLTDKEKEILFRKASQMGVDLDEFEMVLDGRLAKMKAASRPAVPVQEKVGNIKKCPACGAVLTGTEARCPECGHYFTNVAANRTMEKFSAGLQQLAAKESGLGAIKRMYGLDSSIPTYIKTFPIPNTAEDLLEFAVGLKGMMDGEVTEETVSNACRSKLKEVKTKISLLFPNDDRFKPIMEMKLGISASSKRMLICIAGLVVAFAIPWIMTLIFS